MSDCVEDCRDTALTEWIVLFEAVGQEPMIMSETNGLTSYAASGRAYPFEGEFHALWPWLCRGTERPLAWR